MSLLVCHKARAWAAINVTESPEMAEKAAPWVTGRVKENGERWTVLVSTHENYNT